MEQPAELLEKSLDRKSIYWKAVPLLPGLYRLDIAIKDVNNPDHIGIYGQKPGCAGRIMTKSWRLRRLFWRTRFIRSVRTTSAQGNCVIGNIHVCPRVTPNPATPVSFKRNQDLNFWMQVYNLGINDQTKSNEAKVTYQIIDSATNTVVFEKEQDSKDFGEHSDQLTVENTLPMAGLQPGKYKVTIKINDEISKQEIAQSAPFVVE